MKSTYNQNKLLIIFPLLSLLLSCKKFVEIAPPDTQVQGPTVFSTNQLATSAVIGVYTSMVSSTNTLFNGAITLYPGLSADELKSTSTTSKSINAFYTNAIPITLTEIGNFWLSAYNYIYSANTIIEGLNNTNSVSPSVKKQLSGEAKFIRAFTYFYLINLYGDVPLEISSNYKVNALLPRSPINDVYKQIITDLKDAKYLLEESYTITPDYPSDRVRPNKWTAAALLARTYLYTKDWGNAKLEADSIINSPLYGIETFDNLFTASSNEAIWQLMPVSIYNTSEGLTFNPFSSAVKPNYLVRDNLLNEFEGGDLREQNWLNSNNVSGTTYVYPYKYKVRFGSSPYAEYNTVFRLAEQYLIRSEAESQLNQLTESSQDLNIIRTRAGLSATTALTQSELLTAIAHENQIEFFAEWGHRWLDLKRTGAIDSILGSEKPGWKSTAALYPIILGELQKNTSLTQNPGY